jgi:hypothetical protein
MNFDLVYFGGALIVAILWALLVDRDGAIFVGLLWPVGLVVALIELGCWLFRRPEGLE